MKQGFWETIKEETSGHLMAALPKAVSRLDELTPADMGKEETLHLLTVIDKLLWMTADARWTADMATAPVEETPENADTATSDRAQDHESPVPVTEPEPELKPEPEVSYTKEEVKNILMGLQIKHAENKNLVCDVLTGFGYSKLSDVPEEEYAALIAEAKKAAGEA